MHSAVPLSAICLTLLLPSIATSQNPSARTGSAVRAAAAPTVDGRLNDVAWSTAPLLDGFVQREPFEGQPATERTEARVLYDEGALYIGAWLFDRDASSISEGEARRDVDLSEMDAVLLVLDTFKDRQNAFLFGTSAGGVEYDGQVTREGEGGFTGNVRQQGGSGGGLNLNWDGKWDVATARDSAGWYAEFRIPFATLRYGKAGMQDWGLNIVRYIRRRNEESVWSPLPRQFTHLRISMAGTLTGVVAPAQRPIWFTPFALTSASRVYAPLASPTRRDLEVGGDLKVGLTPGLTLDLTYNTDFAQVEVDEQQINLTRFNLFFPEKRPSFSRTPAFSP